MNKDPILEEVHRVRDEIARQHDYDVRKLGEFYMARQRENQTAGQKYVSFPPKRPKKEAA